MTSQLIAFQRSRMGLGRGVREMEPQQVEALTRILDLITGVEPEEYEDIAETLELVYAPDSEPGVHYRE